MPGPRAHVLHRWQTLLAKRLDTCRAIPPLGSDNFDLAAHIEAIESEAAQFDAPFVVVAHSEGCVAVAHWALQTKRPALGALLATPPDLETPRPAGYPTMPALRSAGWLPVPRAPLPFPSIVTSSRDDPFTRSERVADLAACWQSQFIDLGEVGDLNPASGFGDWPLADAMIHYLANIAYA